MNQLFECAKDILMKRKLTLLPHLSTDYFISLCQTILFSSIKQCSYLRLCYRRVLAGKFGSRAQRAAIHANQIFMRNIIVSFQEKCKFSSTINMAVLLQSSKRSRRTLGFCFIADHSGSPHDCHDCHIRSMNFDQQSSGNLQNLENKINLKKRAGNYTPLT